MAAVEGGMDGGVELGAVGKPNAQPDRSAKLFTEGLRSEELCKIAIHEIKSEKAIPVKSSLRDKLVGARFSYQGKKMTGAEIAQEINSDHTKIIHLSKEQKEKLKKARDKLDPNQVLKAIQEADEKVALELVHFLPDEHILAAKKSFIERNSSPRFAKVLANRLASVATRYTSPVTASTEETEKKALEKELKQTKQFLTELKRAFQHMSPKDMSPKEQLACIKAWDPVVKATIFSSDDDYAMRLVATLMESTIDDYTDLCVRRLYTVQPEYAQSLLKTIDSIANYWPQTHGGRVQLRSAKRQLRNDIMSLMATFKHEMSPKEQLNCMKAWNLSGDAITTLLSPAYLERALGNDDWDRDFDYKNIDLICTAHTIAKTADINSFTKALAAPFTSFMPSRQSVDTMKNEVIRILGEIPRLIGDERYALAEILHFVKTANGIIDRTVLQLKALEKTEPAAAKAFIQAIKDAHPQTFGWKQKYILTQLQSKLYSTNK